MDDETTAKVQSGPQTPRLLTAAAAMVLLAVMGAVALSVALWMGDGSPSVAASFGGGNRGPGPGRVGPGAGPQANQPPRGPQVNGGNAPAAPDRQGQGNQQGGTAGADRLSREPDLSGFVGGVDDGSITVQTSRGARRIAVTPSTRVYRQDGSIASVRDISVGWRVAVVTAAGAGSLTATEIAQVPAR